MRKEIITTTSMPFNFVRIAIFLLPLLPVFKALYEHSFQPLGYLVWFMIGSFAHSIAEVTKSKVTKDL